MLKVVEHMNLNKSNIEYSFGISVVVFCQMKILLRKLWFFKADGRKNEKKLNYTHKIDQYFTQYHTGGFLGTFHVLAMPVPLALTSVCNKREVLP